MPISTNFPPIKMAGKKVIVRQLSVHRRCSIQNSSFENRLNVLWNNCCYCQRSYNSNIRIYIDREIDGQTIDMENNNKLICTMKRESILNSSGRYIYIRTNLIYPTLQCDVWHTKSSFASMRFWLQYHWLLVGWQKTISFST